MTEPKSSLTYAQAGVDIDAGNSLVERIKPAAKRTMRKGVASGLGGFGALFDLKAAGFTDPVLVAATDGVGTKLRIAIDTGQLDTIGIDLVAMCVNDLICQGAEPLFFLDYFATGKLDVDAAEMIISGIAEGCVRSGCALIGGETAEMPGMYARDDFDLAGFAVGAMERGTALPRDVDVGDVLIGLGSDGPHSNGYSLIRKIVEREGLAWDAPAPFANEKLGAALLAPTRLYVKPALQLLDIKGLHALAHITGGGLTENLPRVLPEGMGAKIDLDSWKMPASLDWLIRKAEMDASEALKTFNCGIGLIAVVSASDADEALSLLGEAGEDACKIGEITADATITYTGSLFVKVAILISGGGSNMVSLVDAMQAPDFGAKPCLVLSNNQTAKGLTIAAARGIPTQVVDHRPYKGDRQAFDAKVMETLKKYAPDIICLAGFMRILTPEFMESWAGKIINIHPSLLPKYTGLNTHQRALDAGDTVAGCTVHEATAVLDHGPILGQTQVPILPDDTAETLAARVLIEEHKLYPACLKSFVARQKSRI